MRVLVTGATGFIGRALVPQLQREGHTVRVWARSPARARARLGADIEAIQSREDAGTLADALDGCHAVVNLAGEPLLGGRWTAARRASIRNSRINTTRQLTEAFGRLQQPPRVFVSGSAVGVYGDRGTELLGEDVQVGSDFLAQVCRDWEKEAMAAETFGVRVVLLRTGVVLGRDGGAFARLLPPFTLGLGGRIGSGRQFLPWIHLRDLVGVIAFALRDERVAGPVNAVAPEPVTNQEFTRELAHAARRPAFVAVPAIVLKAAMGEAASVLLASQRVKPAVLEGLGFSFAFAKLPAALTDLVDGSEVHVGPLSAPIDAHGSKAGRTYLDRRKPIYELRTVTMVNAPVNATFEFFSKAENLGLITPSAMGFLIKGRVPAIAEDAIIDYRVYVGGMPINWRTRIVTWRPGERFVDFQEQGPYRAWWHEHAFQAVGERTLMHDRVCYAPPFGPLGRVANWLFITPMLRRIFRYRADVIGLRFGVSAGDTADRVAATDPHR